MPSMAQPHRQWFSIPHCHLSPSQLCAGPVLLSLMDKMNSNVRVNAYFKIMAERGQVETQVST